MMSLGKSIGWVAYPELVGSLFLAFVFGYCAVFHSGEGRHLAMVERFCMVLPFVVVPLILSGVFLTEAKTWWWLGRAVTVTVVVLVVSSIRLIMALGSGPKGQDAVFILAISLGMILMTVLVPVCGVMILAEVRPAFGVWFRERWVLGSFLTLLSALPVGAAFLALGFGLSMAAAVVAGVAKGLRS